MVTGVAKRHFFSCMPYSGKLGVKIKKARWKRIKQGLGGFKNFLSASQKVRKGQGKILLDKEKAYPKTRGNMKQESTLKGSENLAGKVGRTNERAHIEFKSPFDCKSEKKAAKFVKGLNIHERGDWLKEGA